MAKKKANGRRVRQKKWIMRLNNSERMSIRYLLFIALNYGCAEYSEDEAKIYQKWFNHLRLTEE